MVGKVTALTSTPCRLLDALALLIHIIAWKKGRVGAVNEVILEILEIIMRKDEVSNYSLILHNVFMLATSCN